MQPYGGLLNGKKNPQPCQMWLHLEQPRKLKSSIQPNNITTNGAGVTLSNLDCIIQVGLLRWAVRITYFPVLSRLCKLWIQSYQHFFPFWWNNLYMQRAQHTCYSFFIDFSWLRYSEPSLELRVAETFMATFMHRFSLRSLFFWDITIIMRRI